MQVREQAQVQEREQPREQPRERAQLLEELTGSKDSIKAGMKWVVGHAEHGTPRGYC